MFLLSGAEISRPLNSRPSDRRSCCSVNARGSICLPLVCNCQSRSTATPTQGRAWTIERLAGMIGFADDTDARGSWPQRFQISQMRESRPPSGPHVEHCQGPIRLRPQARPGIAPGSRPRADHATHPGSPHEWTLSGWSSSGQLAELEPMSWPISHLADSDTYTEAPATNLRLPPRQPSAGVTLGSKFTRPPRSGGGFRVRTPR